jgi:putative membrane protein
MTYTAHMVQHVVVAQLVPTLVTVAPWLRLRRRPHAPLTWIIGVGAMIGTSMPSAYLLAQRSVTVDWTFRAVLLVAGLMFWTPLFGAAREKCLRPGAALLYLITACFATTLAGAYIAFMATATDQQVAGLVMWVPCCLIYLSAAVVVVTRAMRGASSVVPQHAN